MIRKLGFWLFLVSAVLLLIVVMMANQAIQKSKNLVSVVEVTQNIAPYEPITAQDLRVVQIPALGRKKGAITDIKQVLNRYSSEFLPSGVQITSNMVFSTASTPRQMLAKVGQPNQVLVAIPVQTNDIVSEIQVGDIIDIVTAGGSKSSSVVQAKVLKVENSTLLFVLMNQSDYLSIVGNLGDVRIELPVGGQ